MFICKDSRKLSLFEFTSKILISIFCVLFYLLWVPTAHASKIIELNIKGPIGPATADYIIRGIDKASQADLVIITLDTPGGLDLSTRIITQKLLTTSVPTVSFVSPTGAHAASAGTFILYASTLAAMAPGTQLGAASPVSLTGLGGNKSETSPTMDKKVTNDALASIRALAQLRARDPVFAEDAVRNAATMTVDEAFKAGVINLIAKDVSDLLMQLNGRVVKQNHRSIILNTANPEVDLIAPDWRTQFLSIITDPTLVYLLLLLGIYGIFFELLNPGYVLPGVIGAMAMIIALYALQLLPINYAGLGLIFLGFIFIIAEGYSPSFGVLGVGGTVSFIIGSIMLMNTEDTAYKIAWSVIWTMAFVNVAIFVVFLGVLMKAKRKAVKNGLDLLVGAQGRALGEINLEGQAVIRGEIWQVKSKYPISADRKIRVLQASGLTLEVEEDYS